MQSPSPPKRKVGRDNDGGVSRVRKRSPSFEADRKRRRSDPDSPDREPRRRPTSERSWDRDTREDSARFNSDGVASGRGPPAYGYHGRSRPSPRGYENGFGGQNGGGGNSNYQPRPPPSMLPPQQQTSRSKRLYIGNVPNHVGLTDIALMQFFSALYVAGFRTNQPGEPLPVTSFWLHSDGKFGFMELRGEQEAVNMMQFNGVFLHGRPLRVNRPSDYRPEIHNPTGLNLVPESVNTKAVMELCEKLGGVTGAPAQLAAIAASQELREPLTVSKSELRNVAAAEEGG